MTGKKANKREELRERLVAATYRRIEDEGLAGLKARDIAAEAGCALGGLYTVFPDLDSLVLTANAKTLARIDAVMQKAEESSTDPDEQMRALARAYLAFARDHTNAWRALFEQRWPAQAPLPDWYSSALTDLMTHIGRPLKILQSSLTGEALALRARTLFAAVHGVISVSLDNRFVGIPAVTLEAEVVHLVNLLLAGLDRQ